MYSHLILLDSLALWKSSHNSQLTVPLPRQDAYFQHYTSLHLGWNNVRFILATSLHLARLLDRTLIIPSHLNMRKCDYLDEEVCKTFAQFVSIVSFSYTNVLLTSIDERRFWTMKLDPNLIFPISVS